MQEDLRPVIYLSHSWRFRKTGKILQEKLEKLGFRVENPFDYDQEKTTEDIVDRDIFLIETCDVLVAYYGTISIGVTMEIFLAGAVMHKPVYLLCPPAKDEDALKAVYGEVYITKLIEHPWLKYCVTKFFDNTKDLLNALEKEGVRIEQKDIKH